MDNFKEEVVAQKGGKAYRTFLYILTYLFLVVFGVIGFIGLVSLMGMDFSLGPIIQLLLGFGAAYFLWRNKDHFSTEYEYTFTSGEMDFAKVLGGRRRRQLISLSLKDAEAGGSVGSDAYKRYSTMKDIKTIDYTLNEDAAKKFIYFIREGNKHLLIMECSEDMWKMIEKSNPRLGDNARLFR